jgi:hypothetical protein
MNNFRIQVEIPLEISDQHNHGLNEAVRHCLVHNTLLSPPSISLEIKHSALQTA